jgi:hypothetical protein
MIFLNITNSKKTELLELNLSLIEEKLFAAILDAGFMPEEFNAQQFEKILSSLPEEEAIIGEYATYEALNTTLQHYIKIKNSIDLLEKEENGI